MYLVEIGAGVLVTNVTVHRSDVDNSSQNEHLGASETTYRHGDTGHFAISGHNVQLLVGAHLQHLRRCDTFRHQYGTAQPFGRCGVSVVLEFDERDALIKMVWNHCSADVERSENRGLGNGSLHGRSPF